MAKAIYIGVDNVARKVKQPYIGVDNVARKVKSGYIGVDNVARQFFSGGTPMGELEVGSSVYLNVDGVPWEFLVVHQGIPDATIYDSSCDGTWLLMKSTYIQHQFRSAANKNVTSILNSRINTYLNETFFNLLDVNIQGIIKQVKLPYTVSTSSIITATYHGADGYDTTIFILGNVEVGGTNTSDVGSKLDYFIEGSSDEANARRIATFNDGNEGDWWLRTMNSENSANVVYPDGSIVGGYYQHYSGEVRPAFILPSETLIDENFNVIAE